MQQNIKHLVFCCTMGTIPLLSSNMKTFKKSNFLSVQLGHRYFIGKTDLQILSVLNRPERIFHIQVHTYLYASCYLSNSFRYSRALYDQSRWEYLSQDFQKRGQNQYLSSLSILKNHINLCRRQKRCNFDLNFIRRKF